MHIECENICSKKWIWIDLSSKTLETYFDVIDQMLRQFDSNTFNSCFFLLQETTVDNQIFYKTETVLWP